MITRIFKGRSDDYGFFARIENDELVVGRNIGSEVDYEYVGAIEPFIRSTTMARLTKINPELATDISDYYDAQMLQELANIVNTIKEHTLEEPMKKYKKLCEIKVDRADSLKELTYHLTANGYVVQTEVVYKEFPKLGIDYWRIVIVDREEKN
jgi:hypothetical protein